MGRKNNISRKSDNKSKDFAPKKGNDIKPQEKGIISKLDRFFSKNQFLLFIIAVILTIIIGIYLFDVKVSTGGDDSWYIVAAKKFLDGKSFPTWHGSFYPIFLSLIMLIAGVNVVIFKVFSFVFIIGSLILFYYTFKNELSITILIIILFILAVNSDILYFGSQTYSEALYLFLQTLTLLVFIKFLKKLSESPSEYLRLWKTWLVIGFLLFLVSITRNIGIVMLMSVILYLLLNKKFYAAGFTLISYFIFRLPFGLYKNIIWDIKPSEGGGQLSEILYINPYNKTAGTEDFAGMVTRFIENSKIYLSKHFIISIGLKNPASTETSLIPVIIILILFSVSLYFAFRHSKVMLFVGIYLGAALAATFIALQQSWGQLRMIIIYIPLMILLFSWGIYRLSQVKGLTFILQFGLILILCIIISKTLGQTAVKIRNNKKIMAKNLRGNLYYGFTTDWVNFLKMSEWVGKNIPDSIVVASRKPSMSFIYSKGKEFYPIFRVPMENADTLINKLKEKYNNLCTIEYSEFNKKKMPMPVQMNFRLTNLAYIGKGNESYGIYRIRDNYKDAFYNALDQYNIDYIQEIDIFLNKIRNKNYFGVSPDTLLNKLKENNVDYVIVGSLRINPRMKTNRTLNAVRRFLYYIELKYPGTFTLVYQEGENDKEPAYLYKVNYNKYNIGN
jgi:hypothetical protein